MFVVIIAPVSTSQRVFFFFFCCYFSRRFDAVQRARHCFTVAEEGGVDMRRFCTSSHLLAMQSSLGRDQRFSMKELHADSQFLPALQQDRVRLRHQGQQRRHPRCLRDLVRSMQGHCSNRCQVRLYSPSTPFPSSTIWFMRECSFFL